MTGTVGSRLEIIAALSLMSFNVAKPRSGIPSLDIVVPAPVLRNALSVYTCRQHDLISVTHHIQAVEARIKRDSCCEPIVHTRADYDVLIIGEKRA